MDKETIVQEMRWQFVKLGVDTSNMDDDQVFRLGMRIGEAVLEFCRKLRAAVWQEYAKANCPYGESDEGMWRWFMEREEERRREEEDWERRFMLEGLERRS